MEIRTLVPIDFNSLFSAKDGSINLSDFYIDYAFYHAGIEPRNGEKITFYDLPWRDGSPNEIMCIDGELLHKQNGWVAMLEGLIYIKVGIPKRFYSAFIGANTSVIGKAVCKSISEAKNKPLYAAEDKFAGIDATCLPEGSKMPDFS